MKTGLILEGGAVRGIFTAGVLDRLLENEISFPYVIGVSAGGGNAMSYVSNQSGRTRNMINVPRSQSYYGFRQLFHSGKLINLDKMAYEYPFKQFPFDFDTYFDAVKNGEFTEYVCTCMETGEAEYFSEDTNPERLLTILKATCSLPMLCDPVELDGKHYLDGSLADSIPIERALEQGCDRLVIVLTKPGKVTAPTDYSKFKAVINTMYKNYPNFIETCMSRVDRYEKNVALMEQLESEGRAVIIRPTLPAISKFEKDPEKLAQSYNDGVQQADNHLYEIKEMTNSRLVS